VRRKYLFFYPKDQNYSIIKKDFSELKPYKPENYSKINLKEEQLDKVLFEDGNESL